MKRNLIIVGLVVALAIPTAAIAAGHRSSHKAKPGATAMAPKTKAKGSATRPGLSVGLKPSKRVPASARTKTSGKPRAGTRSSRKPKAAASPGRSRTSVRTKPNKTAGTPAVGVTLRPRGGSAASGKHAIGGLALPVPVSGTNV
jgi:hypothetical protein